MADYTRLEKYLDGILNNIPVSEPYTRIEMLLAAIAAKIGSGGGGGASSADDVSYDNTTSGLTATDVQAAIDEVAQGGGETTDFFLTAVATIKTDSDNKEAVDSYTTFSLTTDKDFDTLLAKARTKMLSLGGALQWTDPQTTMIEMRPVEIWKQYIIPSALLAYYGITTNKDGIMLYFDSFNYDSETTADDAEVFRRMGAFVMKIIYEDTNGQMQIIDPPQGG